jgi:hypothetical protein
MAPVFKMGLWESETHVIASREVVLPGSFIPGRSINLKDLYVIFQPAGSKATQRVKGSSIAQ